METIFTAQRSHRAALPASGKATPSPRLRRDPPSARLATAVNALQRVGGDGGASTPHPATLQNSWPGPWGWAISMRYAYLYLYFPSLYDMTARAAVASLLLVVPLSAAAAGCGDSEAASLHHDPELPAQTSALPAPADTPSPPKAEPAPPETPTLTVSAVGDCTLGTDYRAI